MGAGALGRADGAVPHRARHAHRGGGLQGRVLEAEFAGET